MFTCFDNDENNHKYNLQNEKHCPVLTPVKDIQTSKNTHRQLSIFTGSCFACGISLPLCFIIAQVPKQKKTHGTQFFQIDAAGLFSPLCAVHCFWCMRVLC